jgi:hypothetical protein
MLSCRGVLYLTISSTDPLASAMRSIGLTQERTSCPNTVRESTPVTDKCLHVKERCFFSILSMAFLASLSSNHFLYEKPLLSSFVACLVACGVWRVAVFYVQANHKWQFKDKQKRGANVLNELDESILLFFGSLTTYNM